MAKRAIPDVGQPQRVAPRPDVLKAMNVEFEALKLEASPTLRAHLRLGEAGRRTPGYSDGLIYPPNAVPESALGLAPAPSGAPASPGPVRGVVRVIALLVDFPDHPFDPASDQKAHFEQLLFSAGVHPSGSLCDYYTRASYGKVLLTGEIHGPYRLPETYSYYTNSQSGTGPYPHNAQRMAEDTLARADADVNFAPFDPNGDTYVDALVIIHAGPGAEAIPSGERADHIWSHKWVMSRSFTLDGVNLYAYLTVPEDGRLGVFAHELGHLLFQWPDLYDTDYSSAGLGAWCVMAGGSWNNGGDTPALPCAWCRMNQGWADTAVITTKQTIALPRAADHQRILKLWTRGLPQTEYFLAENRARCGFDTYLPGEGLCIYHVDEAMAANAQEPHYKVGLVQADGLRDLEENAGGGDAGDPYPGASGNRTFDATSKPSSAAYSGAPTGVAVRGISDAGLVMTVTVDVNAPTVAPGGPTIPGGPLPPGLTPAEALPRRPVTEVAGIGKARAAKLETLGIRGLADLALATPEALTRPLNISLNTAGEYIAAARLLLAR